MECKKRYRVCVITGTRAEYGVLRKLLFRCKNSDEIFLQLIVTGSHLSNSFGNTQNEIIEDGFTDFIKVPIPMGDDSKKGMAVTTGVAVTKFAEVFEKNNFDIIVVLGDRFEILSAAIAAHLMGIPIAHISGGDVTEGAVDDAIRHCITKMSSIHFPGCYQSAKRIVQMGEQPETVFNVGEPGIENCLNTDFLTREDLASELNFVGINKNYCTVTFHPVTMEKNTAELQLHQLIEAMDSFSEMYYVITMANADAGGRSINDIWLEESKKHSNWLVVTSLGIRRYLSAVKYSQLVIGNSSSGIIEVPSFGVPTINIGDRQKGRMMADSVISCDPNYEAVSAAMSMGLSQDFKSKSKQGVSPFGDGHTSAQILDKILWFLKEKNGVTEKHFYDIDFEY